MIPKLVYLGAILSNESGSSMEIQRRIKEPCLSSQYGRICRYPTTRDETCTILHFFYFSAWSGNMESVKKIKIASTHSKCGVGGEC